MDEILLSQRYSYAIINMGANYSRLVDRDVYLDKNYDVVSDLDSMMSNDTYTQDCKNPQRFYFKVPHSILQHNKLSYESQYRPFSDNKYEFYTTKDWQIRRKAN